MDDEREGGGVAGGRRTGEGSHRGGGGQAGGAGTEEARAPSRENGDALQRVTFAAGLLLRKYLRGLFIPLLLLLFLFLLFLLFLLLLLLLRGLLERAAHVPQQRILHRPEPIPRLARVAYRRHRVPPPRHHQGLPSPQLPLLLAVERRHRLDSRRLRHLDREYDAVGEHEGPEAERVRAYGHEQDAGNPRVDHGSPRCERVRGGPRRRRYHDAIRQHLRHRIPVDVDVQVDELRPRAPVDDDLVEHHVTLAFLGAVGSDHVRDEARSHREEEVSAHDVVDGFRYRLLGECGEEPEGSHGEGHHGRNRPGEQVADPQDGAVAAEADYEVDQPVEVRIVVLLPRLAQSSLPTHDGLDPGRYPLALQDGVHPRQHRGGVLVLGLLDHKDVPRSVLPAELRVRHPPLPRANGPIRGLLHLAPVVVAQQQLERHLGVPLEPRRGTRQPRGAVARELNVSADKTAVGAALRALRVVR
mmetsp:Transcript_3059/g.13657  ORF Transcript_3059/g.13657 Transcript_3059/m.13657 type:complete len:471 (-) Transcript_3059:1033-2445(-)